MLTAIQLVPMWVVLLTLFGLGIAGTINAIQKFYGGIGAAFSAEPWGIIKELHIMIGGGPITLLLSLNPWLPKLL